MFGRDAFRPKQRKRHDMTNDFIAEQKRYLEGFMSGLQRAASRAARAGGGAAAPPSRSGPMRLHIAAQDRIVGARRQARRPGKVEARRSIRSTPMRDFEEQAQSNANPKPDDNFRWRYHGLFYVAPAQDSYMCRLRIPNGILHAWQFARRRRHRRAIRRRLRPRDDARQPADPRDRAENGRRPARGWSELGLTSRGSGADNIRNVTGSADRRHRPAGTARHAAACAATGTTTS